MRVFGGRTLGFVQGSWALGWLAANVAFQIVAATGVARTTFFASLLAVGVQSGYYALVTWMPTYLTTQRHLSAVTSGSLLYFLIGGAYAGYVTAGYIDDAIGRKRTFIIFRDRMARVDRADRHGDDRSRRHRLTPGNHRRALFARNAWERAKHAALKIAPDARSIDFKLCTVVR